MNEPEFVAVYYVDRTTGESATSAPKAFHTWVEARDHFRQLHREDLIDVKMHDQKGFYTKG